MDVKQNSFAVPVLLQLAIEGRQEYLQIKEIPSNYNVKKPFTANFWLICKSANDGKSYDILYDKSKSTDSEIYFLLPSDMFVIPVQCRCTLKLQINESVDFAVENFTIRIKPKNDDEQ